MAERLYFFIVHLGNAVILKRRRVLEGIVPSVERQWRKVFISAPVSYP
jgi:hypothetical protein